MTMLKDNPLPDKETLIELADDDEHVDFVSLRDIARLSAEDARRAALSKDTNHVG